MRAPNLDELRLVGTDAGELIREAYFGRPALVQTVESVVYDLIQRRLHEKYPHLSVVGRVSGRDTKRREPGEFWLLVHEVDGIAALKRRIPTATLAITLMKGALPYRAVVVDALSRRVYAAEKNRGVLLNGERITPPNGESERPAVGLVWPQRTSRREGLWDAAGSIVSDLLGRNIEAFAMHSIALADSRVVSGEFVAAIHFGSEPHDTAAGHLLIVEAGGVASDLDGRALNYNRNVYGHIFARSGESHEQIKLIVQRHLPKK